MRTLDFDAKFKCTITADILEWNPKSLGDWHPDVVLASPPCEKFSKMTLGRNWNRDDTPKSDGARHALRILHRTIEVIHELAPRWWWLENPEGKMRKMPVLKPFANVTITYCRYGEKARMKPTDLWGVWPSTWKPRPRCHNLDPCHPYTPAGTKSHGTQSSKLSPAERALVPQALSLEICLAVEKAIAWDAPVSRPTIEEFA